ncbi:MAG: hypothetical protein KDI39_07190, partial [Pseudomonadales bacterium]|nr:hypothetical protein [Pseudomonadales bacterium]
MSKNVSEAVFDHKVSQFLQHTVGNLAEGYVVSLAELSAIKDRIHQQERLVLKQSLTEKDKELAALKSQLQQAETALILASSFNRELLENNSIKDKALAEANAKIKAMEDAVSKLLTKVIIPDSMIKYMVISTQKTECIKQWAYREGGLIKPNTYDVLKTNADWLGWSVNGFLM